MAKLAVIGSKTVGQVALDEAYERCQSRAAECDNVLIIMQKHEGGILWEASDNLDESEILFMIARLACKLSRERSIK